MAGARRPGGYSGAEEAAGGEAGAPHAREGGSPHLPDPLGRLAREGLEIDVVSAAPLRSGRADRVRGASSRDAPPNRQMQDQHVPTKFPRYLNAKIAKGVLPPSAAELVVLSTAPEPKQLAPSAP
jgi:hypothetical protein